MKSPKELGITKTQRRNLARLAVRFRDLKPNGYKGKFDMGIYCGAKGVTVADQSSPKESVEVFHECGSSGCLLGHAPYLGIGLSSLSKIKSEDVTTQWDDFSNMTFGVGANIFQWIWLFAEAWPSRKDHALKRIAWVLEKGFPTYGEFDQYKKETPHGFKSFKPNWEEIEKIAK